MTTEAVTKAVNEEVAANVEGVAAVAAQQIDDANKNAEALARAAIQTEHMSRLNEIDGRINTWRAETDQRLAEQKADYEARIAALSTLIPPPLPPPPPPAEVTPEKREPTEQSELGKQGEQTPPKEAEAKPSQSQRRRVIL